MKSSIGKKILLMIFIPFLIIFGLLSVLISTTVLRYETNWMELEIKGIAEINAADLAGRINSVRISVSSTADILEKINANLESGRVQAEESIKSMFINGSIYNAWLAYEPQAFDGMDSLHTTDYPGAPSGRFIRSYIMENGEIIEAPDMDEETIDNPDESPWYTVPRDTNRLYIDLDNDIANLYDYGVGGDAVYTLSIVSPLRRDGKVIGCVGADVLFDKMTFGIDNTEQAAVAVFYPNGRVFYSSDIEFAEESIETLGFSNLSAIRKAVTEGESLYLPDEYSIFINEPAFTYFQPISGSGNESSLSLYVARPRAAAFESIMPIFIIIAVSTIVVLLALLTLFIYVTGKISKPIRELTLAADAISQGNLETEIAYFSNSKDEIGLLSQSLHRMVEQFRVYIMKLEQSQKETAIRSHIIDCIKDSETLVESYGNLAELLCNYIGVFKTTVVYMNEGRAIVISRHDRTESASRQVTLDLDFLGHSQVLSLLTGKSIVFLNSRAISNHKITFLNPQTISMCVLPIWKKVLLGYVIFENMDHKKAMNAGVEALLLHISEILADEFLEKRMESEYATKNWTEDHDTQETAMERLRNVEGLDVDAAVAAMDGLTEIYQKSVKLTARLLPETIAKLDKYMADEEVNSFAIEIHGLKGVLKNIGAAALGGQASDFEKAAIEGDFSYCRENYCDFRVSIVDFSTRLDQAIESDDKTIRENADKNALLEALQKSKTAAYNYDSVEALEYISSHSGFSYSDNADKLISDIIFNLETFDCEKALINIAELEEILNDTQGQ